MTSKIEIQEFYSDSPVGISISNEMVRIVWAQQPQDSYCKAISDSDTHVSLNQEIELEPTHCVVLPITGLMRLVGMIDHFMRDEHTQNMLETAQRIAETNSANKQPD